MSIKDWHGGKVVLIWVFALIAISVLLELSVDLGVRSRGGSIMVLIVCLTGLALLVGAFLTPLVLTWKWLSGKESRPKS